jgi:MerR family transcriptional regulator, light-induced transcriptional regulator
MGPRSDSDDSVEDVDEPRLTVSGAARRLGVAPGTLRTWDRRYGIGPTDHTRGRHRRYSATDMARLELMQHALVQGASPAEAARYARAALPAKGVASGNGAGSGAPPVVAPAPARPEVGPVALVETVDGLAPAPPDPTERPVRAGGGTLRMPGAGPRARGLGRAALAMDPVAVRGLLEESISTDGIVGTWDGVARPVLTAVGQRWATTGRGVEVEHLLSECLIAVFGARAAGRRAVSRTARPVLLAGMPSELHVVPLTVLAALLAERGVGCRSLGPALPAGALAAAVRRIAPAAVVLWSQLEPTADIDVVAALPVTRPRFRTYVGGPGWDDAALPPGVGRLRSLVEAGERIGAAVLH